MIAKIRERKLDFMCHHKNTTCEIFFQKEERKQGRKGKSSSVIKTFLLPIHKKYREQSIRYHRENAISISSQEFFRTNRSAPSQMNCKEEWN